jgi:hypothetical protein
MTKNDVHTCGDCHNTIRVTGTESDLLVCPRCASTVVNEKKYTVQNTLMPDDWSIIQLGATGKYKDRHFQVIGRVRLQLRFEYKNFWCIWFDAERTYGWLVESFGSYFMCAGSVFDMTDRNDLKTIHAGDKFVLHGNVLVYIDYMDRCEWVSVEGEIAHWKDYKKGFQAVQAQNNDGIAGYFNIDVSASRARYIVGESTPLKDLNLKGIREWNEFK